MSNFPTAGGAGVAVEQPLVARLQQRANHCMDKGANELASLLREAAERIQWLEDRVDSLEDFDPPKDW